MAVYGGPVPLTAGNVFHVGNPAGQEGASLVSDIMNGVVFQNGDFYKISALDVAMLSDMGVPTILADTLRGTDAGDRMNGGPGDDRLDGRAGEDRLLGGDGFDAITGGAGSDILDGGNGLDVAVMTGDRASYRIERIEDGWRVSDLRPGAPDGVDSLINVEMLQFGDGRAFLGDRILEDAAARLLRVSATDARLAPYAAVADQVKAGDLSLSNAVVLMVRAADATTSVATLSYQFFTGKIPSQAGIDFLVSPTGPNPNNLNSAYYQSFNIENRYINFAVNLGKLGEGKDRFAADYGSLSLEAATKKAYGVIFGSTPTDAKVMALLAGGRDLYFEAYGGDGRNGVGTKAAMVGFLLVEAEKADLGTYARSNSAFLTDLADGAAFNIDLIGVYSKPDYVFLG